MLGCRLKLLVLTKKMAVCVSDVYPKSKEPQELFIIHLLICVEMFGHLKTDGYLFKNRWDLIYFQNKSVKNLASKPAILFPDKNKNSFDEFQLIETINAKQLMNEGSINLLIICCPCLLISEQKHHNYQ